MWLQRERLDGLIGSVHCCWEEPKDRYMQRHGLDFLIDDREVHVRDLVGRGRAIQWTAEPWTEILTRTLLQLGGVMALRLRPDPEFILERIENISQAGVSPAFLLVDRRGQRRKLRVCADMATLDRIVAFLRATEAGGYPHVARLEGASGRAILKSYVPGIPLERVEPQTRAAALVQAAQALALLHQLPTTPTRGSGAGGTCLLVCGADNFNIVVTPEGGVAFIDLEACTRGSRSTTLPGPKCCYVALGKSGICSSIHISAPPAPTLPPRLNGRLHGGESGGGWRNSYRGGWPSTRTTSVAAQYWRRSKRRRHGLEGTAPKKRLGTKQMEATKSETWHAELKRLRGLSSVQADVVFVTPLTRANI